MVRGGSFAVSVVIKQGAAADSAAFTINVLRCDFTDPALFTTLATIISGSASKVYYLDQAPFDNFVFDKLETAQPSCYTIDSFTIENVSPAASLTLDS